MKGEDSAADIAVPVLVVLCFFFGLGLWHEFHKHAPAETDAMIVVDDFRPLP